MSTKSLEDRTTGPGVLTAQQVTDKIQSALDGRFKITLVDPTQEWDDANCDVAFHFDDMTITFFNDAGGLDYCTSARLWDGAEGDFDSWARDYDNKDRITSVPRWPPPEQAIKYSNPLYAFTGPQQDQLAELLKGAR